MSQLCTNSHQLQPYRLSLRTFGSALMGHLRPMISIVLIAGLLVSASAQSARFEPQTALHVVEGDILVASKNSTRSISLSRANQLWTDGIVPYRIDPSLSKGSTRSVQMAVDHWNKVSNISLVSLDDWPAGQKPPKDSIRFQPSSGCASWVGRLGEEQAVWVSDSCGVGSIMHEIGHALGLEHEHTRPDRDQYIQINWDNISVDKQHNFDVAPVGSQLLGDYDYESIMHYGPTNFSSNGKATITPLLVSADTIGQRVVPSRGDLAAIARLYGTDLSIVTQVFSDAENAEVNIIVSNELAQGANTISVVAQVGSGQLLQYAGTGWYCETLADAQVSCTLGRLAGSSSSSLSLTLDNEVLSEDVTAVVRSKTHDDDTLNNADGIAFTPGLEEPAWAPADPAMFRTTPTFGAAALWLWPGLILMLFQRQTGCRIYRHARNRVE